MVCRLSEIGPEFVCIKHLLIFFFSPLMTDIVPESGERQAALHTTSRANGNKLLLTRLFFHSYCFHLISDSHFVLLNGLRCKSTLMRHRGERERERVRSPLGLKVKALQDPHKRTDQVIHRHITSHHNSKSYHRPFGEVWEPQRLCILKKCDLCPLKCGYVTFSLFCVCIYVPKKSFRSSVVFL